MEDDERVSESKRRWPGSVYDSGTEPDPRFSLANERTFLAWIRTGLALLAGAAALDALDLPMADTLQHLLAGVLSLAGLIIAVMSWSGWARNERAMREDAPLPSNPGLIVVAIAVSIAGIVLAVTSFTAGS